MADHLDVDARDRPVSSESAGGGNWGRRILTLLIALAALGGFAVVVVYSYDRGTQTAKDKIAPIVKAQDGPTRVRPEKPGGMTIPHQDKEIYDRLGGKPETGRIENLLPPPEPVASKPPPMPEKAVAPPEAIAEQAASPAAGTEDVAPAASKPDEQKPPAVKTVEPPPAPKPVVTEKPSPDVSARPPPQAGGWRIQIASLRSEDGARKTWNNLRKNHPDLFGRLSMSVERVEISGKGVFFRLQAGTLKDRASAAALCAKANSRKVGCLVVRP